MEAVAKLRNYPTSPRKMRLLADLIRGHKVERALAILEHNPKHPAVPLRKLVLSAINNWKQKNERGRSSSRSSGNKNSKAKKGSSKKNSSAKESRCKKNN